MRYLDDQFTSPVDQFLGSRPGWAWMVTGHSTGLVPGQLTAGGFMLVSSSEIAVYQYQAQGSTTPGNVSTQVFTPNDDNWLFGPMLAGSAAGGGYPMLVAHVRASGVYIGHIANSTATVTTIASASSPITAGDRNPHTITLDRAANGNLTVTIDGTQIDFGSTPNDSVTDGTGYAGLFARGVYVDAITADDTAVGAPTITGGPTAASVPENTTTVGTYTASEAGTWGTSGADAARFSISSGGVLSFSAAPNFENPQDVGGNNVYDVNVTFVATSSGLSATPRAVAVTVTNVNEAPIFNGANIANFIGQAGAPFPVIDLSTRFSDPDAGDTRTFTKGGDWPSTVTLSAAGVTGGTYPAAPGVYSNLTVVGTDAGGLPTPSNLFSISSAQSQVSGDATLEALAAAGGVQPTPAQLTFTVRSPQNVALPAEVLDFVSLRRLSDDVQVLRVSGVATNGAGAATVQSASLLAGAFYIVDARNADGTKRMFPAIIQAVAV